MSITSSSLWGIVAAGEEGARLKDFARDRIGTDTPKQFCAFVGTRTMLERTLRRARLLISSQHLVISATSHHRPFLFQSLGERPPGSLLSQPRNRHTAPGILFPLIHIFKKAPDALVAIFPSDHFVLPGRRLMRAVGEATAYLRRTNSTSAVILAADATYPETEYGWISPGTSVSTSDQTESIFRVKDFAEKPSPHEAERMLAERWVWNTMVLVARGTSLLEFFRRAVPDLVAYFKPLHRLAGTRLEQHVTNEVYRTISSVNFSSAVLARQPDHLSVSPIRGMHWSDWGSKARILRTINALRAGHTARSFMEPA